MKSIEEMMNEVRAQAVQGYEADLAEMCEENGWDLAAELADEEADGTRANAIHHLTVQGMFKLIRKIRWSHELTGHEKDLMITEIHRAPEYKATADLAAQAMTKGIRQMIRQ